MRTLLVTAAVILVAAVASQAAVTYTATQLFPTATLPAGYTAWKINISGTAITGVDAGTGVGDAQGKGLMANTNGIMQKFTDYAPTANSTSGTKFNSVDSHFVLTATGRVDAVGLGENNLVDVAGFPDDDIADYGAGSNMWGAFAYGSAVSSLDLAYLVLSPTAVANGTYKLAVQDGADLVTITGPLVPEPATMSLLALGALGLLRRRSN